MNGFVTWFRQYKKCVYQNEMKSSTKQQYFINGAYLCNLIKIKSVPSLSWSYGSCIYSYLCNQCLSPLTLRVKILLRRGVHDTTLCDKVCQWLAAGRWFTPGTLVSSINKTDRHDIAEISLKVALSTLTLRQNLSLIHLHWYVTVW
jgi:hypothetical protein